MIFVINIVFISDLSFVDLSFADLSFMNKFLFTIVFPHLIIQFISDIRQCIRLIR